MLFILVATFVVSLQSFILVAVVVALHFVPPIWHDNRNNNNIIKRLGVLWTVKLYIKNPLSLLLLTWYKLLVPVQERERRPRLGWTHNSFLFFLRLLSCILHNNHFIFPLILTYAFSWRWAISLIYMTGERENERRKERREEDSSPTHFTHIQTRYKETIRFQPDCTCI